MLPNGKPILLALLAAYCALAAPVKAQPDQFHAVLDALKAQMKAEYNIDASLAVDEVEAFLWAKGVLNNEIYAKLNQEILNLTTEGGFSVDDLAKGTAEYLDTKRALQKRDQEETADDTAVPDAETIKQVVDHGVKHWKRGQCPDGSQADLCCVVM
ncbi:hypothetical protein SLS64_005848 [Diaporthe eres]|uniref:Uncharacterized protein n=1 Tax=Diaporthe eres TaxID=83184 RepID=A0ABR1NY61_DIAER